MGDGGSVEAPAARPDLGRTRRVHLVGAGGAGMSAIGEVLCAMGHRVTGSDAAASAALERLGAAGARVRVGHDAAWVRGAEVVARSSAVATSNVEVVEAERLGLRVWRRAELLASVCAARRTVAVSGTHGKTTTSTMLARVMSDGGLAPGSIVGGQPLALPGHRPPSPAGTWGSGEWLVVEADESDGTFLALPAEAVVVTSVEADHLDYYGDEAAMRGAYRRFVAAATGAAVVCADHPAAAALAGAAGRDVRVWTYGFSPDASVRVEGYQATPAGCRFRLAPEGSREVEVSLAVPGAHNALNAAGAAAMAHAVGVPWEVAARSLGGFGGVARRFQRRGERSGVTYVDDYAHLPSEVAATVAAARESGHRRLVAVFQPHRYSRLGAVWRELADAFEGCDLLVVTDVYGAGEEPVAGVTGELLLEAVLSRHPGSQVRYAPTVAAAAEVLEGLLEPGDLCLTMGAGDITALADLLLAGSAGGATRSDG